MSQKADLCFAVPSFRAHVQSAEAAHPRIGEAASAAMAPGVVDVMGGICEDGGSILVTAPLDACVRAACWRIAGKNLVIRLHGPGKDAPAREFAISFDQLPAVAASNGDASAWFEKSGAQWATSACLAVGRLIADGIMPASPDGLMVLLQSDFPDESDLGSPCTTAAAVIEAVTQYLGAQVELLKKATLATAAASPLTGVERLRIAVTALSGAATGSFLQLRFVPQFSCDPLPLPDGITIAAVRTVLGRPTTLDRIVETRTCAEMGARMILDLRRQDAPALDAKGIHLAAISPSDYVDRYRDRLPSKITAKAFVSRFGDIRGLNGQADGKSVFKVRSRAEHHIYENRRVHDFATNIARARRLGAAEALVHAGELMYASHWSHSQRCGIGGVEADKLVGAIRRRGAPEGLYGAKVTGGGNGGELVVLMRDDDRAYAALRAAVLETEAETGKAVAIFMATHARKESAAAPKVADTLGAAAGV
ncbi:hypothetical protein B7486_08610 [cyanobacterium TDX16]|nr:hypothetical protein B7486_08610 [cyanobacterium TDX16]